MITRPVIILLTLVLLRNGASCQSLSGTVRGNAGDPLPGAAIYFPDLRTGVVTQANGTYSIGNLPRAKTLVQVKLIGYQTVVKTIDLSSTTQMDFTLPESVIEQEEVVITGASRATEIRRNPVPMVSVDQRFLAQNPSANIIESIAKIPGISALGTGPNISKPFIRGLGFNRILTMFDGVRQDGQQWGDEHGIEVDQFVVDRVEVVKGPASLVYGSDALAGVINMIPADPPPSGAIKGSALANYQSNNRQLAGSVHLDGNIGRYVWGGRASKKIASDYSNRYDGPVYGTKYDETDLYGHFGVNGKRGTSHFSLSYYNNEQEVPDGARDSASRRFVRQVSEEDTVREIVSNSDLNSYAIGPIHQRVQHARFIYSGNYYAGNSRVSIKLAQQQSHRQEFSHPLSPGTAGLDLLLNTTTYDVKYYLPEAAGWDVVGGLNGMYQHNSNGRATEFLIPAYESFDAAPFALVKKTMRKVDVSGGIRFDTRIFRNYDLYTETDPATGFARQVKGSAATGVKQFDAYKHTFQGLSGSMGATYNHSRSLAVKANIGRGYRAPNITEISAKGIHPGTGFLQVGDADLKPEFNLQEDIGVFFDAQHFSASAEVFNNDISNYIYNEKLASALGGDSLYSRNGNDYPVYKFRQTHARLYGGEISFDIHPHPLDWLHFENTASVVYAVNLGGNGVHPTDSTRYLPFIPPLRTNTELRADFRKRRSVFANMYVKAGVQYFAAQKRIYAAYGTETETPGYALINAGFGTDIVNARGDALCTIIVYATNLADVAYQNNMSRLKYMDNYPVNGTGRRGIFAPGRNVSITVKFPFIVKRPG